MFDFFKNLLGAALIVGSFFTPVGWASWVSGAMVMGGSMLMGDAARKKAQKQAKDQWNAQQVDRMANTPSTTYDRELVLGRVRKGGHVFFRASAGTNNSKFVMCVALASHQIDAVEQVYLNDVPVTLDADGYVQTDPYLSTNKVSASATIAAGSTSVTLPYTPVAGSVSVTYTVDAGEKGRTESVTVPCTVSGNTVSISAQTVDVTVSYQRTDGASYARVRAVLGSPDQTADARLIELFPDQWTSAHRARGVAYLIVELDYNETAFPSGIPLVTAVIRGARLYDPRTATTAWSENPALMMRHLLTHPSFGRRASISAAEDARITAAANACDTAHSYTAIDAEGASSTETKALYRASTVLPFGATAQSALDDLAQAMAGQWAYAAGEFFVRAGVYVAPALALLDADLAVNRLDDGSSQPISISTHKPRNEQINVITPTIFDAAQDYKQTALPALKASALITRDGLELPQAVTLSAVTYAPQAQHIAGVMIRDARDPLTVTLPFKMSAYRVELFDTVTLTLARFGWGAKEFMVVGRSWAGDGTIQLSLKETSSAITQPDASFVVGGYSANTAIRSPWLIDPPTGVNATSVPVQMTDGSIAPRVLVTWNAITDLAVLDAGFIELQWQAVGDTGWQSVTVAGRETQAYLSGLPDGRAILIRARCRNSVAVSDWNTQIGHIVTGQQATPPAVTALTATGGLFQILLSWSTAAAARADLAYTEIWASTSNNRALAARISAVPWPDANYTHIGLQPGQGWYYWARVVDTSGNLGAWYPASSTGGVSAAPSTDASSLLTQLQDALGEPQLATDLNARIDLIDGGAASTVLPGSLVDLAAAQTATNQKITRDLEDIGVNLLDTVLTANDTNVKITDAGLYVDPATGTVKITTLEETKDRVSTAEANISAANAAISLRATYTYVDNAISTAVLDPSQVPVFTTLETRISTAEADIDALNGAVALKTDTAVSNALGLRLTTAETSISSLEGTIVDKVDTATYTADQGFIDGRLTSAEQTLSAIGDTSSITQVVTQSKVRYEADNKSGEALLRAILKGDADVRETQLGFAQARTDLTAKFTDELEAEAAQRTILAGQVADNAAAIVNEASLRVTAVAAEASARQALAVQLRNETAASVLVEANARVTAVLAEAGLRQTLANQVNDASTGLPATRATLINDYYTKTDTDSAISTSASYLRAYSNIGSKVFRQASAPTQRGQDPQTGDDVALQTGDVWIDTDDGNKQYQWTGSAWVYSPDGAIAAVDARVTTVESAKIGYATKAGVLFDNNGAIKDKTGVDAWNTAHPTDLAVWNVGLPMATAVKQLNITANGITGTIEQRMDAVATSVGSIETKYAIKVDSNGRVVGFELISDGTSSSFGILADKFLIYKPDGSGTPVQALTLGSVNGVTALGLSGELLIDGSVVASRIDSRGLSIKDASGNVILSSGVPLDVANVDGLGGFATLSQLTGGNASTYIADATIGKLQVIDGAITLSAFASDNGYSRYFSVGVFSADSVDDTFSTVSFATESGDEITLQAFFYISTTDYGTALDYVSLKPHLTLDGADATSGVSVTWRTYDNTRHIAVVMSAKVAGNGSTRTAAMKVMASWGAFGNNVYSKYCISNCVLSAFIRRR